MIKFYTSLVCLAFTGVLSAQADLAGENSKKKVSDSHVTVKSEDVQSPNSSNNVKLTKQSEGAVASNQTVAVKPGDYRALPGFPQYVDTGDPLTDSYNYEKAKEKWISENKELYNACVNPK